MEIVSFLRCLLALVLVVFEGSPVIGDDWEYVDTKTPSSYCGLYCCFHAAQSLGVQISIESLVREKYLTGRSGSSSNDLVSAAKDHGLFATWRSGLGVDDLELAQTPLILHVRTPGSKRYNHWMLFLGFKKDGYASVLEPPADQGRISKANLMAIWDGSAVVVTKPDAAYSGPTIGPRIALISSLAFVLLAVFAKRLGQWCIGLTAIFLGGGIAVLPDGFCWNYEAVRNVSSVHFNSNSNPISKTELKELVRDGTCLLIDARPEETYLDFHLPNAVNLPITVGELGFQQFLADNESNLRNKVTVLYCQSEKCGWGEKVASLLSMRANVRTRLYLEGVNGWQTTE